MEAHGSSNVSVDISQELDIELQVLKDKTFTKGKPLKVVGNNAKQNLVTILRDTRQSSNGVVPFQHSEDFRSEVKKWQFQLLNEYLTVICVDNHQFIQ